MKQIKRVFGLLLVSLTVVILASCGGDYKLSLKAEKTTIGIGERLTLNAKLIVKGEEISNILDSVTFTSSDDTVISVSTTGVVEGIKVGSATISAKMTYENASLEAKIKLSVKALPDKPTNLKIEDGVLSWTGVTNAVSYLVNVNGVDHTVTALSFNLKDLNLGYGSYEVKVYAKVGSDFSLAATITYTLVDPELEANTYKAVLKQMDTSYIPNMTRANFMSDYEYDSYVRATKMARAYTNGAMVGNLSIDKTDLVFQVLKDMDFTYINSIQDMKYEMNKFVNIGLTPAQIAAILVEMVDVVIDMQVESETSSKSYFETLITEQLSYKLAAENMHWYTVMINGIDTHGSAEDIAAITGYIDGEQNLNIYFQYPGVIQNVLDDLYFSGNFWLSYYRNNFTEDKTLQALLNVVEAAYYAEDTTFLDTINLNFYILDSIRDYNLQIETYETRVSQTNKTITMLGDVKNTFNSNKADFRVSLTATISYMLNMYDHMDSGFVVALNNLIMSEQATPEEAFILKDELVSLLKDTLPSALEFEQMYLAFVIVMNETLEIDPNEMIGFAYSLGQSTNLSMALMIELMSDFDQTMFNEIKAITEGMVIPGTYDPYYGYTADTYDYRKVVELIVYLGNFKNAFTTEHAVKIAQLEAVNTTRFEEQFILVNKQFITKVMELNGATTSQISLALNLIANQVIYQDAMEIVYKYGNDVFNYFVETNGRLALDIITLIENAPNWRDVIAQKEALKLIGDQVFAYHDMVLPKLTAAEIDLLAEYIVEIGISNFLMATTLDLNEVEYKTFISDIKPTVKTLLKNAITLEIAFANALESNNAFYEFANMSDLYEYSNTVAQIQVALALNVVFTESNKTLINTSVDLIFNEIMSHEFILNLNNQTETSVNESKIRFKAELEIFYTDIARVSGFDFYNLTPAQKDDFSSIWQFGETPQTN